MSEILHGDDTCRELIARWDSLTGIGDDSVTVYSSVQTLDIETENRHGRNEVRLSPQQALFVWYSIRRLLVRHGIEVPR